MRIGASFNFPQLPPRQAQLPPPSTQSNADQPRSGGNSPSRIESFDLTAELLQSRASQSADSARFYSTDRQLPLRGQEAIQTYLNNSNLSLNPGEPEWVGVDIYA